MNHQKGIDFVAFSIEGVRIHQEGSEGSASEIRSNQSPIKKQQKTSKLPMQVSTCVYEGKKEMTFQQLINQLFVVSMDSGELGSTDCFRFVMIDPIAISKRRRGDKD